MTVSEAIRILAPETTKEALDEIEYYAGFRGKEAQIEAVNEACRVAVKALEKQIPKLVEIKPWSPSICPSCGTELSEHKGDGYYKHPTHLEVCHNPACSQRLKWE